MEIVLNLFGGQGIGKSLFFRDLCPNPDWFTDSLQESVTSFNNKDDLIKLDARLIVEMPELNPIKRGGKSGAEKMKQFISTQVDSYRRAYGEHIWGSPRTCALCGTSNNSDVYRDITGDRRFVSINHGGTSIKVGDQDNGVLAEIRNALWGEVISSFREGELSLPPNKLIIAIPPLLREYQHEINRRHRYEEVGVSEVLAWMEDKTRVTWSEIMAKTRGIAGLRDAKESHVYAMLRPHLTQSGFIWKKRIMRSNREGKTERSDCWVNPNVAVERQQKAGRPLSVPHWSEYAKDIDDEY